MKSLSDRLPILPAFVLASLLSPCAAIAQSIPYTLTVTNEPYTSITEQDFRLPNNRFLTGTIIGSGPISEFIDFKFWGEQIDTIQIHPRGQQAFFSQWKGWIGSIVGLFADYVPRSTFIPGDNSTVFGIAIRGDIGSRVLVVTRQGLALATADTAQGIDSIQYQVWLYEGSNMIEVRVGPSVVRSAFTIFEEPVTGPSLGIHTAPSEHFPQPTGVSYLGNVGNLTPVIWQPPQSFVNLSGFPPEGTVFRFTYTGPAHVDEVVDARGVAVYPNPSRGSSTLAFTLDNPAECEVVIRDVLAREHMRMQTGLLDAGAQRVVFATDELLPGVYYYTLRAGATRSSGELVVVR